MYHCTNSVGFVLYGLSQEFWIIERIAVAAYPPGMGLAERVSSFVRIDSLREDEKLRHNESWFFRRKTPLLIYNS